MRATIDRTWLLIAIALPGLVALLVPLPAVDLAYQIRAGDMIVATGAIPVVDTFTFTVYGAPWFDQQWLAQVLLGLGYRVGGWELLAVVRAALVVLTSGLTVVLARYRGVSLRTASILSLLAFAIAAPALALRPQLFAIVLFAVLLVLVAARARYPRAFLLAPLLVVVWANIHGSFVLAPLLLGYAWLDDVLRRRPWRRSFMVLVAGTAATCVTPFGPAVWAYAAGIGADPVINSQVSEWQRTSPLTPTGAMFYAAVIGSLAASWHGRRRLTLADWAWLIGLTVLGAWAVRGTAWWSPGAVLVVAAALASERQSSSVIPVSAPRGLRLANAVLAAALGVGIVAALPWWRPGDPLTGREGVLSYAPSGLAQALRMHASDGARVFAPQTWASWFEWAAPNDRYFVDSRFELFPADVWADYDAVAGGGVAAGEALRARDVAVVVWPRSWPAPPAGWTPVYADDVGSLLIEPPGP